MYPMRPSPQQLTGRAILGRAVAHIPDVLNDPEYDPDIALAGGWRSALAVPMLREGHPIGTILVTRAQPGPFSERQIQLLETFAAQAVIAIENVRLFTELQARNHDLTTSLEQQTATGEILRVISGSPTDAQPVFDTIARSAVRLCRAAFAFVFRYDGTLMHVAAHHNLPTVGLEALRRQWPMRPDRGSVPARAILDRQAIHVTDVLDEPDYPYRTTSEALGIRTMLTVPMLREGQPIGAIAVVSPGSRAFLGPAGRAGRDVRRPGGHRHRERPAVPGAGGRNRDLTESLEQQTATSEVLKVISRSTFDLQPVLETLIDSAVRLCGADLGFIYRQDGERYTVVAAHGATPEYVEITASHPITLDRGSATGRAILDRRVVHVPDYTQDPEYRWAGQGVGAETRTNLAVPMLRDTTVIGVIVVLNIEVRPFTDKQIELVRTFADQAVIAIENVRLFQELEARNRDLTEALEQQTATSEVLKVISRSAFDLQPVLETLIERAARLAGADGGVIYKFDGELMRLAAAHEISAELRSSSSVIRLAPAAGPRWGGRSSSVARSTSTTS